jgi:hypothetical protein
VTLPEPITSGAKGVGSLRQAGLCLSGKTSHRPLPVEGDVLRTKARRACEISNRAQGDHALGA